MGRRLELGGSRESGAAAGWIRIFRVVVNPSISHIPSAAREEPGNVGKGLGVGKAGKSGNAGGSALDGVGIFGNLLVLPNMG